MNAGGKESYDQNETDQDTIDNVSSIANSIHCQDEQSETRKNSVETLNSTDAESRRAICIPIQCNDGITDRGDTWRVWSCIRLSYLIRDTLSSLSNCTLNTVKINEPRSFRFSVKYGNQLRKRGHYFTRRQGKFCWLTLKELLKDHK